MAKKIVFCCDGTWDGPANQTNVYKLFKASLTTSRQVPYYDDGVGSDGSLVLKLIGGAFGIGLFQKVKDAYAKIAHAYKQDDQLFIFGFSRGAYTARSLAGMIAICGLPLEPIDSDANFVETAFEAYRNRDKRTALLDSLASFDLYDAKITMVGVWDTVGSLGIPALIGCVSPIDFGFLDTNLHPDVLNAYQALAIDERRREFPATLWTVTGLQPGHTLEQVWFTGCHCDIGGGNPATGPELSDITLSWMMGKAQQLGLELDPAMTGQYATVAATVALGPIHESWTPTWGLPAHRAVEPDANLGNSVHLRTQFDPAYKPSNLEFCASTLAKGYASVPVVSPPPDET